MSTIFISPSSWGQGGISSAQWGKVLMSWGGYFINEYELGVLGDIKFVALPAVNIYYSDNPAGDIKYVEAPAEDIYEV